MMYIVAEKSFEKKLVIQTEAPGVNPLGPPTKPNLFPRILSTSQAAENLSDLKDCF